MLLLIFAFLINMIGYTAMSLRGWEYYSWTLDAHSSMTGISFVVNYKAITLVSSVALAFVLSLVRVGKRK